MAERRVVAANRSEIAAAEDRTSVAPEVVLATMLLAAAVGTERAAKGAAATVATAVASVTVGKGARMPMARNPALVALATLAANAWSAPFHGGALHAGSVPRGVLIYTDARSILMAVL